MFSLNFRSIFDIFTKSVAIPASFVWGWSRLKPYPCFRRKLLETVCNSSNRGQKSKTRVKNWWRCISLLAHVFSAKQAYIPQRENWNKTNVLINVPKKETRHESELSVMIWIEWIKSIHVLTSFCLVCQSRMPNSRQSVFRPEVPLAPSTRKRPVEEAKFTQKTIPTEMQTPTFTLFFFCFFFCLSQSLSIKYPNFIEILI